MNPENDALAADPQELAQLLVTRANLGAWELNVF